VEKRPTAIFAATDQMAYGVIAAAEECGLLIPRDIALVGFDDDSPSIHVHPSLTTVHQPYYEMGEQGLKLLLTLLDASRDNAGITRSASKAVEETQPTRILLATHLVVRASCGADFQIPVSTDIKEKKIKNR
jgi:LacI family transcriptional regulator